MNHNPFETITYWLDKNSLTRDEKRRMKERLVTYATNHPVRSGLLSPYAFRYMTVALASLVLVLGGSVGITSASLRSLPTEKLYPVKIWIEEFQAKSQKTPEGIIAFETKRIETRFDEATKLAINKNLDDSTATIIQSGIEHSRTVIKGVADSLQTNNPQLALLATNNLETAFSSNGKILASIEKNTNQNIGTIVLAAQVTTEKLALEKVKFEQMVAKQPNDTTKITAEQKLAELQARVATADTATTKESEEVVVPDAETVDPMIATTISSEPVMAMKMIAVMSEPVVEKAPEITAESLIADAVVKMNAGLYSEALVLLQQADQLLDEASLTKELEDEYQVQVIDENAKTPVEQAPEPSAPALELPLEGVSPSPTSAEIQIQGGLVPKNEAGAMLQIKTL